TINNRMFDESLWFLAKNEDELSVREKLLLKGLVEATKRLPQPARQAIFDRFPAPYGITGVNAGETEAVHAKTIARINEQYLVPIEGQSDVVVFGVPYIMPYNVHAFMNPLLVSCLAEGYFHNLHVGAPIVKRGGTMILTHPCSDRFDYGQHAAYIPFVHKILPETRDSHEIRRKYEEEWAADPAFIQMYRSGHAYHPAHAFFMWYWGENGRRHVGRTIVVGADNEYIPKLLGWETAPTMDEALYMARGGEQRSLEVTYMKIPPINMAEVRPSSQRGGG
ncbi:MAG TPA: transcriptional regulator, partial [Polyangiaceae bacterium]|nr:transcriptional regulator [Polyangiaceae bacterium]